MSPTLRKLLRMSSITVSRNLFSFLSCRPSSTQRGTSSSGAGAARARSDSRSSQRPAQGPSRARSRSRSVVDVPGQLSTLEQLVTAVRARATASVVPLALTVGINPPAPRTSHAEPFAPPVTPLTACMPPTAPLAPVRLSTPLSPLRQPSPAMQLRGDRAPSVGPSNINRTPSAGPSTAATHLAAVQEPPSDPITGSTQLTVVRSARLVDQCDGLLTLRLLGRVANRSDRTEGHTSSQAQRTSEDYPYALLGSRKDACSRAHSHSP